MRNDEMRSIAVYVVISEKRFMASFVKLDEK